MHKAYDKTQDKQKCPNADHRQQRACKRSAAEFCSFKAVRTAQGDNYAHEATDRKCKPLLFSRFLDPMGPT